MDVAVAILPRRENLHSLCNGGVSKTTRFQGEYTSLEYSISTLLVGGLAYRMAELGVY